MALEGVMVDGMYEGGHCELIQVSTITLLDSVGKKFSGNYSRRKWCFKVWLCNRKKEQDPTGPNRTVGCGCARLWTVDGCGCIHLGNFQDWLKTSCNRLQPVFCVVVKHVYYMT